MSNRIDGKSMNVTKEEIEQLKKIFQEVFSDGYIDFDKIHELLGEEIDEDKKDYSFTWEGKAEATRLAAKQSTGTLRRV